MYRSRRKRGAYKPGHQFRRKGVFQDPKTLRPSRHSRAGGKPADPGPGSTAWDLKHSWVPACAGTTMWVHPYTCVYTPDTYRRRGQCAFPGQSFRRNNGGEGPKTLLSFPRRREPNRLRTGERPGIEVIPGFRPAPERRREERLSCRGV